MPAWRWEGQQQQRTATHQQRSGSLGAGGTQSHGLLVMHVHHSSGFVSIQGIIPMETPCRRRQCITLQRIACHTQGMWGFGVARSSSPLRDTNTGPIQASTTVNHGMTTPWLSGQTISIPIPSQPSSTPSLTSETCLPSQGSTSPKWDKNPLKLACMHWCTHSLP